MRYLTAGESHGQALSVIVEGLPANIPVNISDLNEELQKRQRGYGRGARMKIEKDTADVISGIRNGKTTGSPITILIHNRDHENWKDIMAIDSVRDNKSAITAARPGHADLTGAIKYNQGDIRNILERSSARETAARVAAGALAKVYLHNFGIKIWGHVISIGSVSVPPATGTQYMYEKATTLLSSSDLLCLDSSTEALMKIAIDDAAAAGTSLGGIFEILAENVPPGLGSHVSWDRKIDGQLSAALMSIQAIKGIEIGAGFELARLTGNMAHDEIYFDPATGYHRTTNRAGGIEGGMTNGETIILRAAMKPIPTMQKPLSSIDIVSKKQTKGHVERADVCAVPAACIIGENVSAIAIASALQEKLGGDYLEEQLARFAFLKLI